MQKGTTYYIVFAIIFACLTISCKPKDKENRRVAERWKKPNLVAPPIAKGVSAKKIRTSIYWNNLSALIDSMYEIQLDDKGTKPFVLYQVGGTVCGLVAEEINKLPTAEVDEDAVRAGQKAYATLLTAQSFYTEFGPLAAAIRDDPGALGKNDPGRSYGAGRAAVEKQSALELQTHVEIAKAHALLVSRYKGVEFRIPHKFQ